MDGLLKATRHVLAVASTLVLALGLSHLLLRPHASIERPSADARPAAIQRARSSQAATARNRRATTATTGRFAAVPSDPAGAGLRSPAGQPGPSSASSNRASSDHDRTAARSRSAKASARPADPPSRPQPIGDANSAGRRATAMPASPLPPQAKPPQPEVPTGSAAGEDHRRPADASEFVAPGGAQVRAERRVIFRPLPASEPAAPLRAASERAVSESPQEAAIDRNAVPPPEVLHTPPLPEQPASPPSLTGQLEHRLAQLERQLKTISERLPDRRNDTGELRQRLQHLEHLAQLDQLQKQIERLLEQRDRPAGQDAVSRGKTGADRPAASDRRDAAGNTKNGEAPRVVTTVPQDDDTFTIHTAAETPLSDVLQQLSELAGTNILPSLAAQKLRVTLHLKNVTLQQALNVLAENYGLEIVPRDDFIFVRTREEADQSRQKQRKIVTRVFRLNYISAQDVQQIIQPLITEKVGRITTSTPAQVGIQQDETNAGGNALAQLDTIVVMDYDDIVEEIAKVVAELDRPPLQVVIEAKILSVQLNDSLKYGINFALLSGSGDDLLVGGNGLELRNSSGIPALALSPSISPSGSFVSDIGGLKYGLLRGDASLFIRAVEQISDTSLIAAPQLRVLNKQRAELLIGQRIAYKTLTFNGTQTVENVNFLDVGTRLILRPFASEDGLVRLEIHPKKSSGTVNDGLPEERTTQVTTNVMVREGTTVVIGGLIEEQIQDSDDRIPLFGSLPGIGALFRNKDETVTRSELIVLLTPRIVRESEAVVEGELFNEEHERRHEHFRNSLTPFNRRNLARFETERAEYYYQSGNLLKARVHIQKALKYSPNDPHARRLRDQIETELGQRFRNLLYWPSGLKRHPTNWPDEATERAGSPQPDPGAPAGAPDAQAPRRFPGLSLELSPAPGASQRPPDAAPSAEESSPATSQGRSAASRTAEPQPPEPPPPPPPVRSPRTPRSDRTPARASEKTAAESELRRMSYEASGLPDTAHSGPAPAPASHAPGHDAGASPFARSAATAFPPSVLSRRSIAPSLLAPTLPPLPALSEITPTLPLSAVPKESRPRSPAESTTQRRPAGTVRRVKRGGRGLR